jgi:dTDP-4-dehydrorhamnose 3,5-epimerase
MMQIEPLDGLPAVLLVQPDVHRDDRGVFLELYHQQKYEEGGVAWRFAQVNFSTSRRGVLRGLHFQHPHPQGKLVSVTRGEILDVAVDIRVGSPTFGVARGARLSADNRHQLYIPQDYAHGFVVLSDEADVVHQCTDLYDPEAERTVRWNDPALRIEWPCENPTLSAGDAGGRTLDELAADNLLPLFIE